MSSLVHTKKEYFFIKTDDKKKIQLDYIWCYKQQNKTTIFAKLKIQQIIKIVFLCLKQKKYCYGSKQKNI